MPVTLSEALLATLNTADEPGGPLYGRLRDDGDVVQIIGCDKTDGAPIGRWVARPSSAIPAPSPGELLLVVEALGDPPVRAYLAGPKGWDPQALQILRPEADYARRLGGLFDNVALAGTTVAVIGLGSGGSVAATQLARCGVVNMRLVDFDRLEAHNVMRHACGLSDVGRYKTRAVADLLRDISSLVEVTTFELDVLKDRAALERIVEGCDLVVAATDTEAAKRAINEVCWPRGIPAVYGAAYNRAFGGDVFRALPPDGPCYTCFQEVLAEFFGPPPTAASDFSPGYADPERMADLVAEPGLSIDIGTIALLLARVALLTLLRGRQSTLPDMPSDWVLFGNRAEWIFEKPLESLFVEVPKRPACPTCSYEAYVRANLAMSPEQAAEEARRILKSVPPKSKPSNQEAEGGDGGA